MKKSEFYKAGDLTGLIPGDEQRANKEKLIDKAKRAYWQSCVDGLVHKINSLWKLNRFISPPGISFWEDEWFPGYDLFLQDIHKAGYYVYRGDPARKNGCGLTQKRFIISLDPIPNKKEIYTKEEDNESNNEDNP